MLVIFILMNIFCPPNYKTSVSASPRNQFGMLGGYTPPLQWSVDPTFGSFIEDPEHPGDTTLGFFVATTDNARYGQTTNYTVTAQTVNGPVVQSGGVQLSFPEAPADHITVTVGLPVPA